MTDTTPTPAAGSAVGSAALEGASAPVRKQPPRGDGGLAARLRVTLLRTSRRLRAERSNAVSEAQGAVLGGLFNLGPQSPSALAEREHVSAPTMTRTIQTLMDLGMVTKAAHPEDKRQVVVSLTEAGEQHIIATRRRRDQWLSRRLASLTPAERQTLSDAEEIMRRIYTK
ncbi:MarR family winged helix-turn-helix transcriptional regulator [Occultella aeris]|uniref:MarR family protein n=1 Tax=Occultella aeris TaxID=2761496 RepID=A0A7M4DII7_9MICO|nr:MarR family transcriptional regulator [Occultella aeris]VZO36761.1 MarR family protein [Occultella aeris]